MVRGKRWYIILFLSYKNLQLKYKHSALGFVWSFLHPFFYLLIFLAVFSMIFSDIPNYPLFVISGLIFWIYFAGATTQLSLVFIKNAHLIKSLNVPKTIYPITELGAELISFILGLIPFLIIMYFMGLHLTFNLLYIIPVILLFSTFIFSVGLILGSLNVFFRDVGILWSTVNPALFYLSPIAYSIKIIPLKYQFYLKLNPIYHFLEIIRDVLYLGKAPSLHYLGICIIITAITGSIAYLIYRKTRNGFISNL